MFQLDGHDYESFEIVGLNPKNQLIFKSSEKAWFCLKIGVKDKTLDSGRFRNFQGRVNLTHRVIIDDDPLTISAACESFEQSLNFIDQKVENHWYVLLLRNIKIKKIKWAFFFTNSEDALLFKMCL